MTKNYLESLKENVSEKYDAVTLTAFLEMFLYLENNDSIEHV